MNTMDELTAYVSEKAKEYLTKTGTIIEEFPSPIVDFVIEYASGGCNFPSHFQEEKIVSDLGRGKNSLAMACAEIYLKSGGEGQISHSENGVSRTYDSAWITFDLLSNFPNYVTVL